MAEDALPESAPATEQSLQESLERFRLKPETISEKLGGDYTPERIVEMINDVEKRKELAETILREIPDAAQHFPDIEALHHKLELMSEILPQKKTFFENVKEKAGWALQKVKQVVKHPVVVTILVGLLAWWAWGHVHEILALAHGEAAGSAAARLGTLGEGAGAINPAMGEGLIRPGGGISVPGPGTPDQFLPKLPSSPPPPTPPPSLPGA